MSAGAMVILFGGVDGCCCFGCRFRDPSADTLTLIAMQFRLRTLLFVQLAIGAIAWVLFILAAVLVLFRKAELHAALWGITVFWPLLYGGVMILSRSVVAVATRGNPRASYPRWMRRFFEATDTHESNLRLGGIVLDATGRYFPLLFGANGIIAGALLVWGAWQDRITN